LRKPSPQRLGRRSIAVPYRREWGFRDPSAGSLSQLHNKRTCDLIGLLPTARPAGSVMRFDWATRISLDNLRPLLSLFSADLAIDLGTVNTRVYVLGRGIVVNEPSAVALEDSTGEVQAIGKEAKEMLGRTPGNIRVVKPLKDGVIADFKVTEKMLTYFIQKAHQRRTLVHPRIVISVPSEITQVEKRAVTDSAYRAKAAEVHLVEQAMMAAIGAGLPVTEPGGNLVVDIGGGTTDVAVISLAGIVYSRSLRMAGNYMDEAIMNYLKRKYNLLIGERTAEQIKIEIGSAYALDKPMTMEIKGRSLIEGVPKMVIVDDSEIREALSECIASIVSAIRVALERTPPELSADISDRGIVLVGGGALLKNLDKRIREETGLPVSIPSDPLYCVVLGTGKMLSDFKLLRRISIE
jgi:rod shape-determining protein MreB and related proteins